jgi:hypothetical protein
MITTHPTVREVMTKGLITAGEKTPFKELIQLGTAIPSALCQSWTQSSSWSGSSRRPTC